MKSSIDCPRAKSDMTPCIARDGHLALSDPPKAVCVGCGATPRDLLVDLAERYTPARAHLLTEDPQATADRLTELVAEYVKANG